MLSLLRRVPAWFWVLAVAAALVAIDRWSLTNQIAELRAAQDRQVEESAAAAKAVAREGLAEVERRQRRLEADLARVDGLARAADEKLRQATSRVAQTREEFARLAERAGADELAERARAMGYDAVPARRPR